MGEACDAIKAPAATLDAAVAATWSVPSTVSTSGGWRKKMTPGSP